MQYLHESSQSMQDLHARGASTETVALFRAGVGLPALEAASAH